MLRTSCGIELGLDSEVGRGEGIMGFGMAMKMTQSAGDRAEKALSEYMMWTGKTDSNMGHEYWRVGSHNRYNNPNDGVFEKTLNSGPILVQDCFLEGEIPGPGECLLSWREIPWTWRIPPEGLHQLYLACERHGVLDLWAQIIHASETRSAWIGSSLSEEIQKLYPDDEIVDIRTGGEFRRD